jgi:DNA modification methylase
VAGVIHNKEGVPRVKKYLHEMKGIPIRDVWVDISSIQAPEKTDYATQKPLKLLERIITLYSNKKDIVLDCFAGSGTTGEACIKLGRNYILMDINVDGREIFNKRLLKY